jgi:hypothetical protein
MAEAEAPSTEVRRRLQKPDAPDSSCLLPGVPTHRRSSDGARRLMVPVAAGAHGD